MSSNYDGLERELAEIDDEEGTRVPTAATRLLPMLVAAVALLSFGAIIYYAYNRGLTTGTEVAAPLITPDGPAKVRPADPGGLEVPHRDKLVYGALDKTADDSRVEQLLPPPEDPMRPPAGPEPSAASGAAEELFPKRTVPIPSVTARKEDGEPDLPAPELATPKSQPPKLVAETDDAADAPAARAVSSAVGPLGARSGSDTDRAEPANGQKTAAATPEPDAVSETLQPANGKTEKPAPKAEQPAKPAAQVAKATPAPAAAAKPAKADEPAAQAGAGWRVQVASVRSADSARTEWARQQKANPDLLGSLDLMVRQVTLPEKGTFFRVQAGPLKDKATAQNLCAALKKKKVGCLIVKP